MKISIALSLLILTIGLSTGLMHHQQLLKLRDDHTQLAARAAKSGITRHRREDRDSRTQAVASGIDALAKEMDLRDKNGETSGTIVSSAKTPQERTVMLAAFRDHLASVHAESERAALREEALGGLARSISGESFESVVSWVANQELTPEERDRFAAGISYDTTKADTGKWIGWMTKNLPPDSLNERVGDLVGQWTQQDYLAAGKWLSAEPDGVAKTAAVKSYAEAVAEYEPQVAAQWAMTLPAGEERVATLRSIYENWPKSDAAAAAAFAEEHGIERRNRR